MYLKIVVASILLSVAALCSLEYSPGVRVSSAEASQLFGGKKGCYKLLSSDTTVYFYCGNCSLPDDDPLHCDCSSNASVYYEDPAGVNKKAVPCTDRNDCGKPSPNGCS